MKNLIDEITGLPMEEPLEARDREYMVCQGFVAYSLHKSAAAARAHIVWKWKRLHPEINFEVVVI